MAHRADGEGEARVECRGDLDALLAAPTGIVATGEVVAVYRGE